MKVFVAGATGRVGKEVVARLCANGHTVKAASRSAADASWQDSVEGCTLDFAADVAAMQTPLTGCDAVIFTAGSRGKDLLQVDAFGAVKLMQAAKQADVQRFVLLSSIFALEPEKWAQEESLKNITNYNIAKFFADEWLTKNSGLDWTVVQPSVLKEEPGTGKITLNPEHDGSNPIPDVAQVLASVIDYPNTIGKVIKLRSGDEAIADALARV